MSAGTIDTRDFAGSLEETQRRLALVEQQISNPDLTIGAGGDGDNVFDEIVITNPGGPPDATFRYIADPPTGLSATTSAFLEDIFIDISWTPGETDTPDYEVEVSKKVSPGVYDTPRFIRTSGTTARAVVEMANTVYGVRVASINRAGIRSAFTSYLDVTTAIDSTVPPAVSGLVVFGGINSITVTFTRLTAVEAPDMQNGNGLYRIQLSSNDFASIITEKYTSSNVEAFEGLTQGTNYKVRVAAIDSSGNQGPYSTSGTVTPGYVTNSVIQTGTISGDRIVAASITGAQITAGSINGDRITTNTLDANRIKTSSLTAADITLAGGSLIANNPVSGTGVLINSQGVRVYKASVLAVNLDATTGDVLVNGTIAADQFTMLRSGVEVARLQSYAPTVDWNLTKSALEFDHGTPIGSLSWDTGRVSGGRIVMSAPLATVSSITVEPKMFLICEPGATDISTVGMAIRQAGGGEPFLLLNRTATIKKFEVGLGSGTSSGSYMSIIDNGTTSSAVFLSAQRPFIGTAATITISHSSTTGRQVQMSADTVLSTGRLDLQTTASEKIKFFGTSNSYISWWDAPASTRIGFIQHEGSGVSGYMNVISEEGGLRGIAPGPVYLQTTGNQWLSLIAAGTGGAIKIVSANTVWIRNGADSGWQAVSGGAYTNASSIKFKKNVREVPTKTFLNKINDLRVVKYQLKEGPDHTCGIDCSGSKDEPCGIHLNNMSYAIGLIAEEVHKIFPESVTLDQDGSPLGLDILQVATIAIAGVKELHENMKAMQAKMTDFEARLGS